MDTLSHPAFSGLLGLLIGLFVGNRLALGRDKRHEFNAATQSLRAKIGPHLQGLKNGEYSSQIRANDIQPIAAALGDKRSKEIRAKLSDYMKCYIELEKAIGVPVDPFSPQARQPTPDELTRLQLKAQALYRATETR